MQWVCLKGVEIQDADKVGGSSFDWILTALMSCVSNFTIQEILTGSHAEPMSRPPLPSSCPGQLRWPGSLTSMVITGCLEEIIQRPHYEFVAWFLHAASHAHKTESQKSRISVTYQIQLSHHLKIIIWYPTTVMLVNGISLMSHRSVIFLSLQPAPDSPSVSNDFLLCCLHSEMAVSVSHVALNENNFVPCEECEWPWKTPKKLSDHL